MYDEVVKVKKLYTAEMIMDSNMKHDMINSSDIKDGRYNLDYDWIQ